MVLVEATASVIKTLAVALVADDVPRIVTVPLLDVPPYTLAKLPIVAVNSPVLGTNARFVLANGDNVVGRDPEAVPKNG
jgi:hypothetical protein